MTTSIRINQFNKHAGNYELRTEGLEVTVTPPALKMLRLKYHKKSDKDPNT